MINFQRNKMLSALQLVNGVVEKRQALPILANILLNVENDQLVVTATDLEIELVVRLAVMGTSSFTATTVDCKKLLSIVKALPESSMVTIEQKTGRILLQSERSRFSLSTLPAEDFPKMDQGQYNIELMLPQNGLYHLLRKSHFSMAEQDVRYYLNGLLLDIDRETLHAVAADGHRLALSTLDSNNAKGPLQRIIPRKAVLELLRLLKESDEAVTIRLGDTSICIETDGFLFTSKLIEGKFPDYQKIIPKRVESIANVPVKTFKQALQRAAILTHQKHRGISCCFNSDQLLLTANNLEHEEAKEVLDINYAGEEMTLGFNIDYLLDIVNSVSDEEILALHLMDDRTGVLFELPKDDHTRYVIMPMRL